MKIDQSQVVFSSDRQFGVMASNVNARTDMAQNGLDDLRSNRPVVTLMDFSGDIVHISQSNQTETQYHFDAKSRSESQVKEAGSGRYTVHEMQSALQKMVGGTINKDVVIRKIEENSRVSPFNSGAGFRTVIYTRQARYETERVDVLTKGQVRTMDGREIDFSMALSLERQFFSQEERLRFEAGVNLTDPLVISLDGKAPAFSDVVFEFDLDNDGDMEKLNFTASGTGWLALDRNGDDRINNGSELFGPSTGNGFEELSVFDADHNQWIDENDEIFSRLSVWTKDEMGKDRLISLKEAGIGAIALNAADAEFHFTDARNALMGRLRRSGVFLFEDGRAGIIQQIDLADRKQEENESAVQLTTHLQVSGQAASENAVVPDPVTYNPFKDLLDKIEALKQRLSELLNEKDPGGSITHSQPRFSKAYEEFRLTPDRLKTGNVNRKTRELSGVPGLGPA